MPNTQHNEYWFYFNPTSNTTLFILYRSCGTWCSDFDGIVLKWEIQESWQHNYQPLKMLFYNTSPHSPIHTQTHIHTHTFIHWWAAMQKANPLIRSDNNKSSPTIFQCSADHTSTPTLMEKAFRSDPWTLKSRSRPTWIHLKRRGRQSSTAAATEQEGFYIFCPRCSVGSARCLSQSPQTVDLHTTII